MRRAAPTVAQVTQLWRRPFAYPFLGRIDAATSPIVVALQQMLVLNDNSIVTFKADHKTDMYT